MEVLKQENILEESFAYSEGWCGEYQSSAIEWYEVWGEGQVCSKYSYSHKVPVKFDIRVQEGNDFGRRGNRSDYVAGRMGFEEC